MKEKMVVLQMEKEELDPADLLLAILLNCQDRRLGEPLEASGFDLQILFYGLKESNPNDKILGLFVFTQTAPVPFSPVLQWSLETLRFCRLIERPDPDNLDKLLVHENGRRWTKEVVIPILSSDRSDLAFSVVTLGAEIMGTVSNAGWRG